LCAVVKKCKYPFLNFGPNVFFYLCGRSSLVSYALKCPVMTDMASSPLSRALPSSALCVFNPKCKLKLPTGHFTPPAVQAVGSKYPFLTAEMVQKNNSLKPFFHNLFSAVQKNPDHTYRFFHTKRDVPVWCSNNYLGMSHHPKIIKAIIYAVQKHGASAGGAPNISITSNFHVDLHYVLPDLPWKDVAELFTLCFVMLPATSILRFFFFLLFILQGCEIYSEAGNHASVIQGLRNSWLLEKSDSSTSKIVAIRSMDGKYVVLLLERCAYLKGCATLLTSLVLLHLWMNCMLEDYKAPEEEGLKTDKVMKKMDIISGTLCNYVPCCAAGFFSTKSLPPMLLAGEYIKILKSEEGQMLRRKHQTTVKLLRQMLMDSGFPVVHCPNHIILTVGNAEKNTVVCDTMMSCDNINVQAIDYPAVDHTPQMMDYFFSVSLTIQLPILFLSPALAECNFCQQLVHFER
uniref:5'-aminolevulinate synthase 1 n=1 Tax=Haplochromis burtoni TaxID=8153 RepID=A0A3Q2XCL9_HAPBU